MTDIVERLRDRDGLFVSQYCKTHQVQELRHEAADEIERLRALLQPHHLFPIVKSKMCSVHQDCDEEHPCTCRDAAQAIAKKAGLP